MTETAAKPATTLTREDVALVDWLRKASICVYLAAEKSVADELSKGLTEAADRIIALASQSLSREAEIRREVIEECAKVADSRLLGLTNGGARNACKSIAQRIRALAQQPDKEPK